MNLCHVVQRVRLWALPVLLASGALGMPLHAQHVHSQTGAPRALVRNELASVTYKIDLLWQYQREQHFLLAAHASSPKDQRLKTLAGFVDFLHKRESHRLAVDMAAFGFSSQIEPMNLFFKHLETVFAQDPQSMAFYRVLEELYIQKELSGYNLQDRLVAARRQSQTAVALLQARPELITGRNAMDAARFKDLHLPEVVQRWERAMAHFDKDPRNRDIRRMLAGVEVVLPPKTVVLTFDDGPHPQHTPAILDTLRDKGVKAMFFQLGSILDGNFIGQENVKTSLAIEQRLLREGHLVANHTYSHPRLSTLSFEAATRQIREAADFIDAAARQLPGRTFFFRPPYGDVDYKTLLAVEDAMLYPLFWNVDPQDWQPQTPDNLINVTLKGVEAMGSGVVLLHDIHGHTAQALPGLIDRLRARGYGFGVWNGKTFERQP